ncbi:PH domain-containing protein [Patescibacteria group bacterium]|nr:PH domain-containing protein [Patescibacteria group bacterium]MBU1906839.1 PH domain-containing protein [Patescibacteria group bacterium]
MDVAKLIQLKPEEELLMAVVQDWKPFIPKMVIFAVWFIVPWFFLFPLFSLGWIGVGIFVLLVLSCLFFAGRSWFAWQRTIFVVTDRRLVDIEQRGLFDRTISELFYSHIDDVTWRKKGVVATLLGYGTVLIRTAGSAADIEVLRVRQPARLHDLINEIREAVIDDEPKNPKTRKLNRIAHDLNEEEIEVFERKAKSKVRKKAMNEFFGDDF